MGVDHGEEWEWTRPPSYPKTYTYNCDEWLKYKILCTILDINRTTTTTTTTTTTILLLMPLLLLVLPLLLVVVLLLLPLLLQSPSSVSAMLQN